METISSQTAYADSDHIKRDYKKLIIKGGFVLLAIALVLGILAWFVWPGPALRLSQDLERLAVIFNSNDLDGALAEVEGMLTKKPNDSALLTAKSLILAQKGSLTFQEEEYGTQAVAFAERAIAANAKNSEAYRALGYAYEIQEKYEKAHENYTLALSIDPDNIMAIFGDAHCYDLEGNMIKAEEGYRLAISKDPQFDQGHLGLARALAYKGDRDGSLEMLKKAFELTQNTRVKAEAAYSIAKISLSQGDSETALTYSRQATEIDPGYPLGWFMYGTALFTDAFDTTKHPNPSDRGAQMMKSFEYHQKALALNPDQAVVYVQLGTQFAAINRPDDAAEAYRRGFISVERDITLNVNDKAAVRIQLEEGQELLGKVTAVRALQASQSQQN